MSQEGGGQEKTEQASTRKLEKARERGQIARSNDVPTTMILMFAILYLWFSWDDLVEQLKAIFAAIPPLYGMDFRHALRMGFNQVVAQTFITLAIPFTVITLIAGIVGNVMQFGFLFAIDPILPRPEKVNPADGFKRIFSARQFINTLLALAKTILMALVLLIVLRTGMKEMLHAVSQCHVLCQKSLLEYLIKMLISYALPLLIVIAVLDYLVQRAQFLKEQRMTKEEVKREQKDMYGDPHIRGARHSLRRELAEQDIHQRIKTARVLILDMSGVVALQYEQGVTPLPLIVAIGKGAMARKMVEIATVENIPLISNPTLARTLAEKGKLDQYIPEDTIEQVALVMRQLNNI